MPSSRDSRWSSTSRSSNRPCSMPCNGTNITKAVIDAYNVKSGVPAPPAAAGAPAAPKPAAGPSRLHLGPQHPGRLRPLSCARNLCQRPRHSPGPFVRPDFSRASSFLWKNLWISSVKPLESQFLSLVRFCFTLVNSLTHYLSIGIYASRPDACSRLPKSQPIWRAQQVSTACDECLVTSGVTVE